MANIDKNNASQKVIPKLAYLKYSVSNESQDKENIPKNCKEINNQISTKFTIYKTGQRRQLTEENLIKTEKVMRIPLKDVCRNNACVNKNISAKIAGQIKDFRTQTELSEGDEPVEKISKARDSYPLNFHKLYISKFENKEPKDSVEPSDTKNVTYKRHYDSFEIKDSLYENINNSNDVSFFEDAIDDEVLHVPRVGEVKSTPFLTHSPPKFEDIKLIRKLHIDKLKPQEIVDLSPLVLRNKIEDVKSLHSEVLGTVNLDVKEPFVNTNVLYSPMYLESIIFYMLKKEKPTNNITKINSFSDGNRSVIVNWLVKLQMCMTTEHSSLYSAVRLLDKTLQSTSIPLKHLQLVALTCFWISLKYNAAEQKAAMGANNMAKLTAGAYTARELLDMELMIFKSGNCYNIHAVDISIYVHYYLLLLRIADADIISECSHYLLTCSYLNSAFVFVAPSQMAAAAVFTSLYLLNQYSYGDWIKLKKFPGYYSPKDLFLLKENLVEVLKQVSDASFPCREPFFKYSSSKHHRISLILKDNLMDE